VTSATASLPGRIMAVRGLRYRVLAFDEIGAGRSYCGSVGPGSCVDARP